MPLASLWKRKFIVSHVAVLAITCVLENLITDAVFFFWNENVKSSVS